MPEVRDQDNDMYHQEGDTDVEARDEAHGVLNSLSKESFNPADVVKWVSTAEGRKDLFADLVVGRIVWARALGRPRTETLSEGFLFETKIWADIHHTEVNGEVTDLLWGPGLPATVRDGPFHPEHYSVSYLFRSPSDRPGKVQIELADVSWIFARKAHGAERYLSTHGFGFEAAGAFLSLPDINVDSKTFFHP